MGTNESVARRAKEALVGTYNQQPVAIVRGEGCTLFDADGRRYLDMIAGIATVNLGHCHPKLVTAVQDQATKLWHTGNLVYTEPQVTLAERLCAESFAERVFFCNSGAEANEAALKLARRWQRDRGEDRYEIIAFEGSFHGRTLFTVSATGQPKYWQGFEPMVPGIRHAPFGDLAAVEALIGPKTAAILVEPVQGEGGVRPASKEFLQGLRRLTDEHGLVLIFDEVQTGMGRTGPLFAYQHYGVEPDVMTLAKALGNGIPIGAMCTTERFAKALVPGTHASTFGGNPLATRCAQVVLEELVDGGVLEEAQVTGEYLGARLQDMKNRLGPEKVVDVRGLGMLWGTELPGKAAPVVAKLRELGVIANLASERVVRFAPPLIIEHVQVDEAVAALEQAIGGTP